LKPHKDKGSIIVRLYDPYGDGTNGTIELPREIQTVTVTNNLEKEIAGATDKVKKTDGRVEFNLSPFEILTLKIAVA
jgi:alpha-mannosidase